MVVAYDTSPAALSVDGSTSASGIGAARSAESPSSQWHASCYNRTLALRDTEPRPGGSRTEGLSLAGCHSHVPLRSADQCFRSAGSKVWVEIADGRGCGMPSQRDGSHPT